MGRVTEIIKTRNANKESFSRQKKTKIYVILQAVGTIDLTVTILTDYLKKT